MRGLDPNVVEEIETPSAEPPMPHAATESTVSRDDSGSTPTSDFDSDFDAWFDPMTAKAAPNRVAAPTPVPPPPTFDEHDGLDGLHTLEGLEPLDPEPNDTLELLESAPVAVEPLRLGTDEPHLDLPPRADWAFRYEDLGQIGTGATSVVHEVRDRSLGRRAAVKWIRPEWARDPVVVSQFGLQARIAGRLHHPGVPAVTDLGTTRDGRVWLLMELARGDDLATLTKAVLAGELELSSAIAGFLSVVEVIAHSHANGVVHGDLKPTNLRVLPLGQGTVLDWGLAQCEGEATKLSGRGSAPWMAPEQLRGEVPTEASDVYALGAMLYLLLAGEAPFVGTSAAEVAAARLDNERPRPLDASERVIPEALAALCEEAMQPSAERRTPSAKAFAEALRDWAGSREAVERAEQALREARRLLEGERGVRAQGDVLLRRAEAVLSRAQPWETSRRQVTAWSQQDEGRAVRKTAAAMASRAFVAFENALSLHDDENVRIELIDALMGAHLLAESTKDTNQADALIDRIRQHARALHRQHPVRLRSMTYLQGAGSLTLEVDPPGAEVFLHRYEVQERRLVAAPLRLLGKAPLTRVELPMGRYLLTLSAPGRAAVNYPVTIGRGEHWHSVAPGESTAATIHIPDASAIGFDDVVISAGWFDAGAAAIGALPPQRLWCNAFVMRTDPVTLAAFREFCEDTGQPVPAGSEGRDGAVPVTGVDFAAARAFAAWEAQRTGEAWRLPCELEFEKASRGVDGRTFPWGDRAEARHCRGPDGVEVPGARAVTDVDPDVSPYGVRGLGTNVACWCADAWTPEGRAIVGRWVDPVEPDKAVARVIRGGSWRVAGGRPLFTRTWAGVDERNDDLGIRLVRTLG